MHCGSIVALVLTTSIPELIFNASTSNNLVKIWFLIIDMTTGDGFPQSLAALERSHPDPLLFVTPPNSTKTASMKNVEDWTDYIYVGDLHEMTDAAMLISPPENHGEQYGYVVRAGGNCLRLPAVCGVLRLEWPLSLAGLPKLARIGRRPHCQKRAD
jgi:hypothetical protein